MGGRGEAVAIRFSPDGGEFQSVSTCPQNAQADGFAVGFDAKGVGLGDEAPRFSGDFPERPDTGTANVFLTMGG